MNKLVKKSMAGLLAGVMAVTSLAVGSFSAMAKDVPDASTAIALGQTVAFTRAADDTDGSKVAVYSFKPATSGYYAISFSSDAVVDPDYGTTYIYSNDRLDNASLDVYYNDGKNVSLYMSDTISSYTQYTANYAESYTTGDSSATASKTTYAYVNGYEVMNLSAQNTYYFYANLNSYTDAATSATVYTKANMTITAADYTIDSLSYNSTTVKTATATGYEKVTTRTPYYGVRYAGAAKEIIVPDQLNGVNVEEVNGTDNSYHNQKTITALTLGKNVKYVGGFNGKQKLAALTLNEGLEEIGGSAFSGCLGLTGRVVIPASVKFIGSRAFYDTNYSSAQVLNPAAEIGAFALGFKAVLDEATVNPTDTTEAVAPDFFIIASTGATAFNYGAEYGVEVYDPANCAHKWVVSGTKAATYFAKGSTTYTCAICGATKSEAIAKNKLAIKSVKSAKKGQITVKTDALASKVTSYQIQYSTSKKFTKKTTKTVTVKVNSKKALNKTIKGLKAGKKYYVRVRVTSGKKNSAYTATKTVTVKK